MHKLLLASLAVIFIVLLVGKEAFEEQARRPLIDWVYDVVVQVDEDKPLFEKVYIDEKPQNAVTNCTPFDFSF